MDWTSFIIGVEGALAWSVICGVAWLVTMGLRILRRVRTAQDKIYDRAVRSALDQPYRR